MVTMHQIEHVFSEAAFPEITFVEPKASAQVSSSVEGPGETPTHIRIRSFEKEPAASFTRQLINSPRCTLSGPG